jgi:hypothetical protein
MKHLFSIHLDTIVVLCLQRLTENRVQLHHQIFYQRLTGFRKVLVQKKEPIIAVTTNLNRSTGSGVSVARVMYRGNNNAFLERFKMKADTSMDCSLQRSFGDAHFDRETDFG